MRENVLNLEVVLSNGDILKTSSRAKKSSSGYVKKINKNKDLRGLFVGSEGTLGIITEVTVKLYGVPEFISSATCSFNSIEDAAKSLK
jgi:D-lactate dehydrogenase (cytochrome)